MKATGSPSEKIVLNGPASPVQHAFAVGGKRVPSGQVVQLAEHRSPPRISAVPALAGMIRRLARNVGQLRASSPSPYRLRLAVGICIIKCNGLWRTVTRGGW